MLYILKTYGIQAHTWVCQRYPHSSADNRQGRSSFSNPPPPNIESTRDLISYSMMKQLQKMCVSEEQTLNYICFSSTSGMAVGSGNMDVNLAFSC